jgi:hypothetical protein
MVRFAVDMRGLNTGQRNFVCDCLSETGYLTVRDEQTDFIKIELSDVQNLVVILTHYTDVRKSLADILNSCCQQRGDLSRPNRTMRGGRECIRACDRYQALIMGYLCPCCPFPH